MSNSNVCKSDVFGIVRRESVSASNCSNKFMKRLKAVFNPELGRYDYVEDEPLNLDEVIQSYKDDSGLEVVRRMMARGEDLSLFADDGSKSGDYSVDTCLADSNRLALEQSQLIQKIADALGVSVKDDSSLDNVVSEAIKSKFSQSNEGVKDE